MKYFTLIYILFFGYQSFAQSPIFIDQLKNTNLTINGDERLYIIDDNISKIFFENDIIEKYIKTEEEGENYIFLPIINNELLNRKITSKTFNLKIVKKDEAEIFLTINYTPKYIYKPETEDKDIPIVSTQNVVNSPKVIKTKFESGDNILNDAKFLMKDLDVGKESHELQMLKQDVLKKYNIDYNLINQQKFLAFYNRYLGGANNALPNQHTSNIAKTDVTNFATGMARFLADRAKAEMNESFFKVMYNHIDKNAELKHFFYQSHNYLNTSYSQNRMINMEAIKDVFEKDIRQFPVNMYDIKNLDDATYVKLKDYKYFMNHTSGGKWVDYGFEIMRESNWRMNPKELIESLNSEKLASIVFDQIDPEFLKSKLFESIDYKTKEVYYAFKGKKLEEIKSENLVYLKKEISEFDFKKLSVNDYSRITAFLINESLISNKNYNLDYKLYNFVNSVKLLELISNSLLSPEENRYWVSSKEIESLFRDKALLETYLGLLIAKSEFDVYKISFMDNLGNIKSLKSLLEDVYEDQNYLKFTSLIQDTHKTLNSVDEIAKGFENASNESKLANVQRLFSFVGESMQTFNSHFNYRGIFKEKYPIDNDKFTKFVMPSVEITMHLQSKQYNLAIEDAVVLLSNISQDDDLKNNPFVNMVAWGEGNSLDERSKIYIIEILQQNQYVKLLGKSDIVDEKELQKIIQKESITIQDIELLIKGKEKEIIKYLAANKTVKEYFNKQSKDYSNFISKFATYGTLIANVATAQNSDQVKAAIEASVLPVGSSRIKRNSNWSITANAYVGGYYGRAFYKQDVNGFLEKRSIDTFGITAPMGISFSKGNLKVFKQNSSLGINLQLIDLGSLVNFYMQEGDGASLPRDTKIQLGDIIAPGGSISYSIGDTPFTLLGGVQYVPNLSRMEVVSTNSDFKPLTWRMHIGIAIDIPLFNIKIWN